MKAIFFIFLLFFSPVNVVLTFDFPVEYQKAVSLIESGKRREAAVQLKELIRRYPDWGLFYLEYVANCIYIECPKDEIKNYLDKAESLIDNNPRLLFYKGLFLESENPDESLRLYDKAISLRPTYMEALIRACILYSDKGDYTSALSYYDAISEGNKNSALVLKIVDLLVKKGDFDRAEKELLWLVKNNPTNQLFLFKLHDFYNSRGDRDKAKVIMKKINNLSTHKKRIMRPLK
ncbi:MAG: tetratricopeptide repeat protein [Deltaproteobacteria bacterium]|nr:tetratricopeptide repeat protein [Deltaproteobacteria bacterium]